MIHIFYAENIKPFDPIIFKKYLDLLPKDQCGKLQRFYKWEDAQAYLLGRLLLRNVLMRYQNGYTLDDLKFYQNGKPYISDLFDFNISHSGSYVICAYSDEGKIGIDLELIKRTDVDYLISLFSENEIAEAKIAGYSDLGVLIYHLWTIKEAAIKADGRGLTIPLNQVMIKGDQVLIGRDKWVKKKIDFEADYAVHLVSEGEIIPPLKMNQIFF